MLRGLFFSNTERLNDILTKSHSVTDRRYSAWCLWLSMVPEFRARKYGTSVCLFIIRDCPIGSLSIVVFIPGAA